MSRARRALPHGRGWSHGLLLTGGFVGIAVAGMVVAAQLGTQDGGETRRESSPSAPGTVMSASGVPASARASDADPAAACAAEIAAAEEVVKSARIAVRGWQEHVQARTDLLTGTNTEATTKAIWKRTRLAGPSDIARLEAATAAYRTVVRGCERLESAEAGDCKLRLAALEATAVSGRAATGDWAAHLAMMRAHAAGEFGAEHAQDLWVTAWEGAAKNLNAFVRADAALSKTPSCRTS